MKNKVRKFAIVTLCAVALGSQGFAQNTVKEDSKIAKKEFSSSLNEDQKAMRKADHEKRKAFHKEFSSTLNANQKAIVADKSLSKKERVEKLGTTLTPAQKEMRENNKKQAQENRKAFKNSLTENQKKSFKEMHKHSIGDEGHKKHHIEKQKD